MGEKDAQSLRTLPDDEAFWLCNNQTVHSLHELAEMLPELDDTTFRYHIQRDRNDFEDWIKNVIGDRELAREIARVKTKQTLAKKITARVRSIEQRNARNTGARKKITRIIRR